MEPAPVIPNEMSRCRNRGWRRIRNPTPAPIPVPENHTTLIMRDEAKPAIANNELTRTVIRTRNVLRSVAKKEPDKARSRRRSGPLIRPFGATVNKLGRRCISEFATRHFSAEFPINTCPGFWECAFICSAVGQPPTNRGIEECAIPAGTWDNPYWGTLRVQKTSSNANFLDHNRSRVDIYGAKEVE